MRRIVALVLVFGTSFFLAGFALPQQSPDMEEKVAAARAAADRNQEALRGYSWISKTEILLGGEVKNTKIESCQYGPDGTIQKTELTEAPQEPEQQQRGRRGRGARIKERIVARKTGEMQQEMQAAVALAHSYVPPAADKMQAVAAAGGVSVSPADGALTVVRFADYAKDGDSLTLTLDTESLALSHIRVESWMEDPEETVTLEVRFQSLPDGTSYAATTVLAIPGDEIEVHIENSNYAQLAR